MPNLYAPLQQMAFLKSFLGWILTFQKIAILKIEIITVIVQKQWWKYTKNDKK